MAQEMFDTAAARRRGRIARGLASLAGVILLAAGFAAPVSAQNLKLGKQVFQIKINCPLCHGWAANGVQEDPREPRGANLRETVMDKEAIMNAVKCGLPETSMPYFDRRAYVDDRCYGMTAAEMGDVKQPPGNPNLIGREIEAVADYVLAKIVGRGEITFEECVEFFEAEVSRCNDFPRAAGG